MKAIKLTLGLITLIYSQRLSLDRQIILALIIMTWDGETIIISLGMIKPQEIHPHSVTNCTIKQIRSSIIKRSIHHLTSILPTSNGNNLHIVLNLRNWQPSSTYRSPQQQS